MFRALVIEDDREAARLTQRILYDAGFTGEVVGDAEEAYGATLGEGAYDLVVIDRRLPERRNSEPRDTVGDELLDHLLETETDVPFVVFTGYSDKAHMQQATQDKGALTILGSEGGQIDRCYVYEKTQTTEFADRVSRIRDLLRQLDRVDVQGVAGTDRKAQGNRRLLARVGLLKGGIVVEARPFAGGLADGSVWGCQVFNALGVRTADVVVKVSGTRRTVAGGLSSILPAGLIAARTDRLEGLAAGLVAEVFQLASAQASTLMEELAQDPSAAAAHVSSFAQAVGAGVSTTRLAKTLEDLIEPLIKWPKVLEIAVSEGLDVPDEGLLVGHMLAAQHGDLHPANLIVDGTRCVAIDFDSQFYGSVLSDPVTLMLGSIFHRDSPLRRGDWPAADQFAGFYGSEFTEGSPCADWFDACWGWITSYEPNERELWAVVYGYTMRQLKYADVRKHVRLHAGAKSLVNVALSHLR